MQNICNQQMAGTIFPSTREAISPPTKLINNGRVILGTFEQALPEINFLDSKSPLGIPMPRFIKKNRLKEWQAYQIDSRDFFLLGAIYQTGFCAFNILSLWDKSSKTLTTWQDYAPASRLDMAKTLLCSENELKTGSSHMKIINRLEKKQCHISGEFKPVNPKTDALRFDFELNSCSEPSVVSMPLGVNRGLYTHKELFEVSGSLILGGKVFQCQLGDLCIIDDHKGFYPYKLHYDWVTGFQRNAEAGVIGFNLTKNQVIEPDSYNENWLWVNGKRHPLPPVAFIHTKQETWLIKDAYGYVDLTMQIEQNLLMRQNYLVAAVNYRAAFGTFCGTIKDSNGVCHKLSKVYGMGEDKTYRI